MRTRGRHPTCEGRIRHQHRQLIRWIEVRRRSEPINRVRHRRHRHPVRRHHPRAMSAPSRPSSSSATACVHPYSQLPAECAVSTSLSVMISLSVSLSLSASSGGQLRAAGLPPLSASLSVNRREAELAVQQHRGAVQGSAEVKVGRVELVCRKVYATRTERLGPHASPAALRMLPAAQTRRVFRGSVNELCRVHVNTFQVPSSKFQVGI